MLNTSLTNLSMRANDIRSAGVATLSTGLKKNIGLISLDLADNDIGDRYLATVPSSIAHAHTISQAVPGCTGAC